MVANSILGLTNIGIGQGDLKPYRKDKNSEDQVMETGQAEQLNVLLNQSARI